MNPCLRTFLTFFKWLLPGDALRYCSSAKSSSVLKNSGTSGSVNSIRVREDDRPVNSVVGAVRRLETVGSQ